TNAIHEYNYVFEIADAGDGLNIADNSSGGIIRYNEVAGIHGENAAIYIYGATDMQILCNLVRDSGYGGNDGIKVGAKNGGDATKQGVLVKGNVVHNITQDGISVYMSGVTVEENEIYNCRSENGAIYVAYGVSDVTIRNNKVYDNTLNTRKWDNPGAIMIGTAVNAATVYVNANNIYGNWPYGVTNKAAATLDATGNWWGAADGPSGEGPGSGDAVSTNVSFANWLAQPQIITDPCVPLDDQGPVTSNVTAAPEPVQVGNNVAVMANVDDSATGGSSI
ncbi:MAG: right-handed parallel beta-helix repeat-containing protein, partial [Chloroflexi bacterium]|nr:right-handed parallel beta-helix repeat-containing protein [Chloroflexota bacterium]